MKIILDMSLIPNTEIVQDAYYKEGFKLGSAEGFEKGFEKGYAQGHKKGSKKGFKKGYKAAREEIVTLALVRGKSYDEIMYFTGFSWKEIEAIDKKRKANPTTDENKKGIPE